MRLPDFASSLFAILLVVFSCACAGASAQNAVPSANLALYHDLRAFSLGSRSIHVENLVLHKDRATITFRDGMIYFPAPVAGKVRGAVFEGAGSFHSTAPPSEFERDNVRRLLGAEEVSLDFKSAVLRFTDDTFSTELAGPQQASSTPASAAKLAAELDGRVLEETGANLSARQLISIINAESPGFFFAEFDGSPKGRFSFILDYQERLLVSNFAIDAGERGLIYAFDKSIFSPDIWLAFYSEGDYQNGRAQYSDVNNLISIPNYAMDVDVTEPKKMLRVEATMRCRTLSEKLTAIPMAIGEDLAYLADERKKKQLHVTAARLSDGRPIEWLQEPWEGGFTLIVPTPLQKGEQFTVDVKLAGEFMFQAENMSETYFPLRSTTWYPRHGLLQRSVFDLRFLHRKKDIVASIGLVAPDEPAPERDDQRITEFHLAEPVALTSFSVAPYQVHKDQAKMPDGRSLPIEFYSMPGDRAAIKEDFILAELNNCIRYFTTLFGPYPYPVFRAAYHPFGYGQGFPTTLMIPGTDKADKQTYQFIAHETSHQWWGDAVVWRSYRDQWLSEGFAEYSGLLYTQIRGKTWSQKELIQREREELKQPPRTPQGIGKGRLIDVGPLILGHRLSTRDTGGAYTALVYGKGALVLRMLHFLFTDPQTGDGQPFFDMMKDFTRQHANGTASTADFFAVANAHVGETALARRFGYKDLNWFYRQWVVQTYLPSYRVAYSLENQPDGSTLLTGTVAQEGIPDADQWFMPLPLVITMTKGSKAVVDVAVLGKEKPFKIRLPGRPQKIELDPELWILSDHMSISMNRH